MTAVSDLPRKRVIRSTWIRLAVGLACALLGVLIELGLDEVVGVAQWLIVAFASGVLAAVLGGVLGGIVAAIVGSVAQIAVIPAWVPTLRGANESSWQVDVGVAIAALVIGLTIRQLLLDARRRGAAGAASADDEVAGGRDADGRAGDGRPAFAAELATLAAAVDHIRTARTPAQIADAVARHVVELTRSAGAIVYVARETGGQLVPLGRHGTPDADAPDHMTARVADAPGNSRGPIASAAAKGAEPEPERDAGRPSFVEVPIARAAEQLALVRLATRSDGSPLGLGPLVDAVIALAAEALERVRLEMEGRVSGAEAAGAVGRLSMLARLAADLVGGTNVKDVATTLVDLVVDDLDAGFAAVHVAEPTSGVFELVHARGYPAGLLATERTIARDAASPVTRAAETGGAIDIDGEEGWRAEFPAASNLPAITGVRAITAIPMTAGAVVHGVLTIGWRTPADRARVDRELLATAADQGAQAIERAILHANDQEARRFQEAFIGVVSHELRTPITTILAGSRLLSRRLQDDPSALDLSQDIEVEADRLARIVDDLLVLSRLERRHLTVGDEPVHLDHLLRRVIGSEAARWPDHRFEALSTAGSHVVVGDETYIEQVLRNLISNAAKYSARGSLVEVVVEDVADTEVRVLVLDEGPGVAPKEIDDLFSLFYRSPSTAASAAGAGIGLFVSRRLVSEMGGRMWARPRAQRGSEFGFSLGRFPIDEPEPDEILAPRGEAPTIAPGNRRAGPDGGQQVPEQVQPIGVTMPRRHNGG